MPVVTKNALYSAENYIQKAILANESFVEFGIPNHWLLQLMSHITEDPRYNKYGKEKYNFVCEMLGDNINPRLIEDLEVWEYDNEVSYATIDYVAMFDFDRYELYKHATDYQIETDGQCEGYEILEEHLSNTQHFNKIFPMTAENVKKVLDKFQIEFPSNLDGFVDVIGSNIKHFPHSNVKDILLSLDDPVIVARFFSRYKNLQVGSARLFRSLVADEKPIVLRTSGPLIEETHESFLLNFHRLSRNGIEYLRHHPNVEPSLVKSEATIDYYQIPTEFVKSTNATQNHVTISVDDMYRIQFAKAEEFSTTIDLLYIKGVNIDDVLDADHLEVVA